MPENSLEAKSKEIYPSRWYKILALTSNGLKSNPQEAYSVRQQSKSIKIESQLSFTKAMEVDKSNQPCTIEKNTKA
jgi:hypothetical protein